MEQLKEKIAALKEAMSPEALRNLSDEELADLKALIHNLRSMMDGSKELENIED